MDSDEELLDAWRRGNRRAGQLLFARYFEVVRRFFANKVDCDPEDLIQTTFTACVGTTAPFEGRSSFRAYLLGIARNVLLKHWRGRGSARIDVDVEDVSLADMGAGPSSLLTKERSLKRLLEALRMLPLRAQIVLELYYWEEMTGPELAVTLGISEAAARSRLHRAKEDLAALIRRLERTSGVVEAQTDANFESWAKDIRNGPLAPFMEEQ